MVSVQASFQLLIGIRRIADGQCEARKPLHRVVGNLLSSPEQLYESLTQKLAVVPDDTVLFPGHMYSPAPSAPMGEVRQHNYVYRPRTKEQWMMMFGHDGY